MIAVDGAGTTDLTLAALAPTLAPFDLKPRKVKRLACGTVNSNYRVDTDGGTIFVRVNEGKSEADVRFEAALLWHLGARRYPTPQPLRRSDGRPYALHGDKCVTAFPWILGAAVAEDGITVEHAGKVGLALGQLHRLAADFSRRRDGIYTLERIARRIDSVRSDERIAQVIPVLDAEVDYLRGARAPSLPTGTIHGDLFPDNVLWSRGEIAAVLDFEQASSGRFAYDLAVTVLAWCWNGADLDERRVRSLVGAYSRVRSLDDSERDGFFAEARLAALRFTVTRITDVFLPGLERAGKDYRDYLARLLRLRELGAERVRGYLTVAAAAT